MKILSKIATVAFFPIYWMIDMRKEVKIIRELLARKCIVDVENTSYDKKIKMQIARNVINVANGHFLEEDSQ
jgi:hypothetical protein